MKGVIVYGFNKVLFDTRTKKPIPEMISVTKKYFQANYGNIIISSRPKQLYYSFVANFLNTYQIPYFKLILKDIRDRRESWEFKLSAIYTLSQEYQVSLVYEFDPYIRRLVKERLGINALPPEYLLH